MTFDPWTVKRNICNDYYDWKSIIHDSRTMFRDPFDQSPIFVTFSEQLSQLGKSEPSESFATYELTNVMNHDEEVIH